MVSRRINTTLREDLAKECNRRGIPWARALEVGVMKLISQPHAPESGVIMEQETLLAKKTRQADTLQAQLLDLNDQLYDLKGGRQ